MLVFLPSLENGFVSWDDPGGILKNPHFRGLGPTQVRWMFTTFHMGHYQPLSWLTLSLDHCLWGLDPVGYHLTSLLLHAANAVLVYWLFRRLLALHYGGRGLVLRSEAPLRRVVSGAGDRNPARPPIPLCAGLASLLFALHPLRVESVAWVTERRDVLSAFFFLLAVLAYLRAAREQASATQEPLRATRARTRRTWLAAALAMQALSLFSKAIAVMLPAVLIILDFYPLRRLGWGKKGWFGPASRPVWLEKAPFALLSVTFAAAAFWAQAHSGTLAALHLYTPAHRAGFAAYGTIFYLVKTALPFGLYPIYEVPSRVSPFEARFLAGAAAALAITALLILARKRWPAGLSAWACYLALVAPVSGIAQSGPQIAADRYTYLSCLPWPLLAGAGLLSLRRGRGRLWGVAFVALTAAAFGALTLGQARVWRNSRALWLHVLQRDPSCTMGHLNLGELYLRAGRLAAARRHAERAIVLAPADYGPHFNLGLVLVQMGKVDEAVWSFRNTVELKPDFGQAHNNLGWALGKRGHLAEAVLCFRNAVRLLPSDSKARYNLASALKKQRRWGEAIRQYRRILRTHPSHAPARLDLARLLAACPESRFRDGAEALVLALQVTRSCRRPNPVALAALAAAYAENERFAEAAETAKEAAGLALAAGLKKMAATIRAAQALYQARKPYRLPR